MLAAAIAGAREPHRQGEMLMYIIRESSTHSSPLSSTAPLLLPAVLEHCIRSSSSNTLVRRLAYSFILGCGVYVGEEWDMVFDMITRDAQNDDVELCLCALECITVIPAEVTLKRLAEVVPLLRDTVQSSIQDVRKVSIDVIVHVMMLDWSPQALETMIELGKMMSSSLQDDSDLVFCATAESLERVCAEAITRQGLTVGKVIPDSFEYVFHGQTPATLTVSPWGVPESSRRAPRVGGPDLLASQILSVLQREILEISERFHSLPQAYRHRCVRFLVTVISSTVLCDLGETKHNEEYHHKSSERIEFFLDHFFLPSACSLDSALALESCRAILELSRFNGATKFEWIKSVVEGCLMILQRRESSLGSERAMKLLLVAVRLLPSDAIVRVCPNVLREINEVKSRSSRVEYLLILLWTMAWIGPTGEKGRRSHSSSPVLHSAAVMDLLQHDPDQPNVLKEDFVACYAQACLLPCPQGMKDSQFIEARAIEFLEMFHICLRWSGSGSAEAAKLYMQLLSRCCARAISSHQRNYRADQAASGQDMDSVPSTMRLKQILKSVMSAFPIISFHTIRSRVLCVLSEFLYPLCNVETALKGNETEKEKADLHKEVLESGRDLIRMIRLQFLGTSAQRGRQELLINEGKSGNLRPRSFEAKTLAESKGEVLGWEDTELLSLCLLRCAFHWPQEAAAVDQSFAEMLSANRDHLKVRDPSMIQRIHFARSHLRLMQGGKGEGDEGREDGMYSMPYGVWPLTASPPPSEDGHVTTVYKNRVHRQKNRAIMIAPDASSGSFLKSIGVRPSEVVRGPAQGEADLSETIQDKIWNIWGQNMSAASPPDSSQRKHSNMLPNMLGKEHGGCGSTTVSAPSDIVHVQVSHTTDEDSRQVWFSVSVCNRSSLELATLKLDLLHGNGLTEMQPHAANVRVFKKVRERECCSWNVGYHVISLQDASVTVHCSIPTSQDPRGAQEVIECEPYRVPFTKLLCPFPKQAVSGHYDVQTSLAIWSSLEFSFVVSAFAPGREGARLVNDQLDSSPFSRVLCNSFLSAGDELKDDLYGGGASLYSSFQTSALSQSWFGDLIAVAATGHFCEHLGSWRLFLEFRTSSAIALSILTSNVQVLVETTCGKHVVEVQSREEVRSNMDLDYNRSYLVKNRNVLRQAGGTSALNQSFSSVESATERWRRARASSAHDKILFKRASAQAV
ncbi:hypothetical protein GUITHDRAFT_137731 [Guillardia theta CCMP2712]|uniref:Uncharacterized protein n=4 Tax=Guillardia theta TaxID=55529 RepID=L1JG51_GUITC|nr:hypothetical protein GUITHDRAFT_137731 [Guillardia theta CCMP2712]EKX47124.1 hypothetical protein GUITHDRAFT_137731 [Guillardia theta CCMP2712]|eukprot:XP_005834104.1 hypothetical protein GUITHDRAFT_137731 [Guillardia theta CCMP2712]